MTTPDPSYILTFREAAEDLSAGSARIFSTNDMSPAAGSQAEKEMSLSPRPESIVSAFSIAQFLIEYSGEQLSALIKTLHEPIEPLAACACVRSMLEPCAIAAWMADPCIGDNERVARQFAHRYQGLDQHLKFARVAGRPQSEIDKIESRIDDVESTALSLGYPAIVNSKNKRIGIAQRMPGATEIIGQVLDKEDMYRLLSAVAHGHIWAHMRLGFVPVAGQADMSKVGGVKVQPMEKAVNVDCIAYIGLGAIEAIARPMWNFWHYMGWERELIVDLLEDVFDTLQVNTSQRFWPPS